jgi:cysteine desulfurase/selenocysteine lyase
MGHLGVTATARASFALYNTRDEVDVLVKALGTVHVVFA